MTKNSKAIVGIPLRPAFSSGNVPVIFSTDNYYGPVLGVFLKSICEARSAERGYDFIVLHGGLAPRRLSALLQVVQGYPNVSLRFVNVSTYIDSNSLYTANRSSLSREAYFRLLIPDLFIHYEKMLYLDCDMIAVQDVAGLFDVNMEEHCIAAVPDVYSFKTLLLRNAERYEKAGSPQILQAHLSYRYFNSGTVLFNLSQIRKEFPSGFLWLTALSKTWKSHDQDVLNHVFFEKVLFLHFCWNFNDTIFLDNAFSFFPQEIQKQLYEAKASPAIVHYIYPRRKPWQYVTHHSIRHFWPVAVRTPFYDELLERQLKFAQDIVVIKSGKGAANKVQDSVNKETFLGDSDTITPYEIMLSQQRLILQTMLQNKELEYRLRGKNEDYARRRLDLLAQTDGDVNKIKRITPKRVLSFEFSLCGHCNMRCKGCAHFAPLVKEDFADFASSDKAFARLGQLFGGEAESIHLLGGEPLLHPRIQDFLESIRKHFPLGKIEVVSNGLLLPKMEEAFWRICRENKIQISVTKYPIDFDYVTVQAMAAFYGVKFAYYGNSDLIEVRFNRLGLDLSGGQAVDESFMNCYVANECITLKNGRLYPCSIAPNMDYFAQQFGGLEFSPDDSLDIFAAKDKEEVLDFLSLPNPLCRYCLTKSRLPFDQWGHSKGAIEEWTL